MRHSILLPLILILLVAACGPVSGDEVVRVASPDGRIEAVLFETNGTSFGYEVQVLEKGKKAGDQVAKLYGAMRNDHAYGANLRWASDTELIVEFLEARDQTLEKGIVRVAGRDVNVVLKPGVPDPDAPAGGMHFNLLRKKEVFD